jgi:hypothetical protein
LNELQFLFGIRSKILNKAVFLRTKFLAKIVANARFESNFQRSSRI